MLEQQEILRRRRVRHLGRKSFDEGDQQVDGEDEEFAHGTNRTNDRQSRARLHRTGGFRSYYEFATDTSLDPSCASLG